MYNRFEAEMQMRGRQDDLMRALRDRDLVSQARTAGSLQRSPKKHDGVLKLTARYALSALAAIGFAFSSN